MLTELQILQQLKEKYDNHLVSALIGSGFTKNIYDQSPSWRELLKELVIFAYDAELKDRYRDYAHKTLFPKCYDKYLEPMINSIIQRDGYLDVVSNYIKKKGYREAIDLYLEEKNPYFYIDGRGIKVHGDNTTILYSSNYEAHKSLLECAWQHVFTTNFDNALEVTSQICNLGYSIITNDYQLSRKCLNKAIIKIHGNLVDRKSSLNFDKPFEFDGDKTRRYIISREDFDTYFQKHQAFSYLLRIALLSGVYCLIGFSGDDPNFLGWLEWVKDILDREPRESIKKNGEHCPYEQIKVFLILIGNASISDEKKLFYRNHHIGIIHLENDDIKREIGLINLNPSNGQLFQSLFTYLQRGNNNSMLSANYNVPYYSLWRNVYKKVTDTAIPSLANDIAIIKEYRKEHRFIKSCVYQEKILEKLRGIENLTEERKAVLVLALKDMRISPNQYNDDFVSQIRSTEGWAELQTRKDTFSGVFVPIKEHNDSDIYENIIRQLYHFDFETAYLAMKAWKPQGTWISVKASVSYIFDRKEALTTLDEYIKNTTNRTEKYIASVLYGCIDSPSVASPPLEEYKGLDGISEMLYFYIQQITKKEEDILPYGQQQDTQTLKDLINSQKYACRALHFIADSGLNTCYGCSYVINIQDWYEIFFYTYKFYPWPCLYYSAQYNNKQALKRIGQDYAYEDSLSNLLPKMLKTALNRLVCHSSFPVFSRCGLFQITGEFFVAIPESEWYSDFKEFLQCFVSKGDEDVDYIDAVQFVSLGLNSILDPSHIAECFTILLTYFFVKSSDAVALICEHLRLTKITPLDKQSVEHIQAIVNNDNYNDSIYLFDYMDKLKLLDDDIKINYLDKIFSGPDAIKNMGMRSLLHLGILAKDSESYRNILIQEILSRDFWGMPGGTMVGGKEYYFRFTLLPSEYVLTRDQIATISSKLEETFSTLIEFCHLHNDLLTIFLQGTFEEMNRYIKKNPNYFTRDFIERFKNTFNEITGYSSFEDALYCETSEKIDSALYEIFNQLDLLSFSDIENLYNIAVQRLLIKQTTSNTNLLFFVAKVFEKHSKEIAKNENYLRNILRILQIYAYDDLRTYNFQVVDAMRCFIKIASLLPDNCQKNEYVQWWHSDNHMKKFNYL